MNLNDIILKHDENKCIYIRDLLISGFVHENEHILCDNKKIPFELMKLICFFYSIPITIRYNHPLPVKSVQDRVDELLMTPQYTMTKRLEYNHTLIISKECPLLQLKQEIANKLGLQLNEFRLRRGSNIHQPQLKDMNMTINAAGFNDGGIVYIEYGIPAHPKQICITFSLYDRNKLLTDPHRRRLPLKQKLFEYPFNKDIKVSVLKKEVVQIINKLFPLYRNKYNLNEAIMILKQEEKEKYDIKDDGDTDKTDSMKLENIVLVKNEQNEDKKEEKLLGLQSDATTDNMDSKTPTNGKRLNLFGIEHIRLRKQRGAKVTDILFDDRKLSTQIMGKKHTLQLVIEKIMNEEHFTKNQICFWLQKYRPDQGKNSNGKIFKKIEFVIDKTSKIIHVKRLIANLLKKKDKKYIDKTDDEIIKNISITKGFATSTVTPNNINRAQWVHRVILKQMGINPDSYFYRLQYDENTDNTTNNISKTDDMFLSDNGRTYTQEELLNVMQNALAAENDMIISRPPFHLRTGDLIVWTNITWLRTHNAT